MFWPQYEVLIEDKPCITNSMTSGSIGKVFRSEIVIGRNECFRRTLDVHMTISVLVPTLSIFYMSHEGQPCFIINRIGSGQLIDFIVSTINWSILIFKCRLLVPQSFEKSRFILPDSLATLQWILSFIWLNNLQDSQHRHSAI